MKRFSYYLLPLALIAGLFLGPTSQAAETPEQKLALGDNTDRIFVPGIRPWGMGGAFVAIADDENLLFYNPAGLSRLKHWRFTLPYYLIGTDIHSFDQFAFWAKNSNQIQNFPNVPADVANALTNGRMHALLETSTRYVGPNFGFGVYLTGDALVTSQAVLVPEFLYDAKISLIENLSFGWGWDIPGFGYLGTGLAFKALQRMVGQDRQNALVLASAPQFNFAQLWGGGFDLGLLYGPTDELTVAVVMQDLYTRFMEEVQVPNLKVGLAYKPKFLNYPDLTTTIALDIVDLNWQGDNEFKNNQNNAALINLSKARLGLEFILSGLVALRGGVHQGYPTAGFGLETSFINLEWAYFARELGAYPGQNPEWNHRISVDWHTGGPVHTPTPSPTATPTITPTPLPTATFTVTPTAVPDRPTPQPTLTGKIPKLHGVFVGFTGTITVVPKVPEDAGDITSWVMVISNERGVPLKRYSGSAPLPRSFVWNAKDARGERVSSKEQYPYTLTLETSTGAQSVSGTLIIVDTIPKLYTSKNFEIYGDKVYFSIKQPVAGVTSWKLDVFDDTNQVVRSYVAKEELFRAFSWDSKDESGAVVANNASYRYELSFTDSSGNQVLISDRLRPVLAQIYQSESRSTIKIGNILFDTGKAYLTAEMFDKVIKSAYVINDEPASDATVDGHTDSTGSVKLNMKLSLVRAESVRQFLVNEQNVPGYQVSIQGWGPTKPVATNKTAAGRKQNRRDEVVIRLPR